MTETEPYWYARVEIDGVWCSSPPFATEGDVLRWAEANDLTADVHGPFEDETCLMKATGEPERYDP